MGYLSQRSLEGLRSYAYKPCGYTYLDELHQPVWNCASAGVRGCWGAWAQACGRCLALLSRCPDLRGSRARLLAPPGCVRVEPTAGAGWAPAHRCP